MLFFVPGKLIVSKEEKKVFLFLLNFNIRIFFVFSNLCLFSFVLLLILLNNKNFLFSRFVVDFILMKGSFFIVKLLFSLLFSIFIVGKIVVVGCLIIRDFLFRDSKFLLRTL